jgi:DNA topoisomerase-1
VKESEQKRSARAPFTTSTLQQTASTRLGFSPSRTMQIAQRLYEAGHITYMRTDSTILASEAQKQIIAVVAKAFGKEYVAPRQYKTKSRSAQEAHEAIRPTDAGKKMAGSTVEQKKLYELIRARALASQMSDARVMRTTIRACVEDESTPAFAAHGSRVVFDGWLAADPAARGEDVELPKVKLNDLLTLVKAHSEYKQTQPPNRYTEAGLIKELEKRGIGRPSTYASTMKTLQDRGYVDKEGRTLIPTDTGDVVSSFLEKHFGGYISDTFTAEMEDELDEIAEGKREYEKTLHNFWEPFHAEVEKKEDIPKLTTLGAVAAEFTCPECGGEMVYKLGKSGTFMSCATFPECHGARTKEGGVIEPPKELDEKCPECGNPLIEREGRYGRFVSCSTYPKCKYVKRDELQNSTGVKCLACGNLHAHGGRAGGEIVEKRGRFGPFYACSNYPDCRFTMKARPTGNVCPECGKLMMQGTKTIPERCSDKSCSNHNPHKK